MDEIDMIKPNEKIKELNRILRMDIEKDIDWLYGERTRYEPMPLISSKMSKIIGYLRSDNPFGFISAFRKTDMNNKDLIITRKENMDATRKLVSDIRNKKYGYIQVLGAFEEHDDSYTNDNNIDNNGNVIGKHHVKEISMFAVGFNADYKTFKNYMKGLMDKYKQEGIITGYCKNKGDRPENDDYFIESINFEGNIVAKSSYSIKDKDDMGELIKSIGYQGHTKIDKKNFVLSYYTYKPNSMIGTYFFELFENVLGLKIW
jgi:hypothetical protein